MRTINFADYSSRDSDYTHEVVDIDQDKSYFYDVPSELIEYFGEWVASVFDNYLIK